MHIEVTLTAGHAGGKTYMATLIAHLLERHAMGNTTYEIRTRHPLDDEPRVEFSRGPHHPGRSA